MHKTLCHGRKGLCKEMKPVNGVELLKYLRKVNFTGSLLFGISIRNRWDANDSIISFLDVNYVVKEEMFPEVSDYLVAVIIWINYMIDIRTTRTIIMIIIVICISWSKMTFLV